MANAEVGSAYVSIYPQTDGNFSKMVGRELDKGSSGLSAKAVAMGNVLANAFTSVASTVGSAIGDTITDAFWNYASYEQLVGGVDKLFGDSSKQLQSYAAMAYKTSGMSANQYMEQATSFSAALINSLDGDTSKAADLTDVAMRAMSDNVNTFGSNAQDVQNAIQGISRENYTMLDNLKLGYAGTKQGFSELVADANAYAESIGQTGDLTTDSFADAIRAIDLIQQKQGIAGTTAAEASGTLEGSINQAKAAWDNFLTSFGTDAATVTDRAEQLFDSLKTVGENVFAYVQDASVNALTAIMGAFGMSEEDIAAFFEMFDQLGQTVQGNIVPYVQQAGASFQQLAATCQPFTSQVGPVLITVFKGIIELVSALVGALALAASMFADTANQVINAAAQMWDGAGQAIDGLNNAVSSGWQAAKDFTASAWDAIQRAPGEALSAAQAAIAGPLSAIQGVLSSAWNAATGIVRGAANAISGAINGISSVVGSVQSTFNSVKSAITRPIEAAKNTVHNVLNSIKRFFPLSVGRIFSNLQIPHISVNGGSPPFGIGGKGSLPSFSVSWNAEGGFTDGITVFGAGERGTELLLPRRGRLMDDFAAAVSSQVDGGGTTNIYIDGIQAAPDSTLYRLLGELVEEAEITRRRRS